MPIRHNAREVLPHTLAHDAGLAVMHAEAFLHQNRGDMNRKALNLPSYCFTAGERQVVCVSRIPSANRFRQSAQATINTVAARLVADAVENRGHGLRKGEECQRSVLLLSTSAEGPRS